jgi:transcription-repair coupling factor (superfamily II helicase)
LTERRISTSLFAYGKSVGVHSSLATPPLGEGSEAAKAADDANAPSDFQSIRPGDIIVHEDYGVGRFMGLERIGKDYIYKDYLKIAYHGDEVLYVPPEGAAQIEKYIGTGSVDVKISLSRLSARAWARKKKKTREDIRKVAEKLVHIYAERSKTKGFAFAEDSEWQKNFEESFPFEETEDQLKAIAAVKKDMEKQTPMDRLILGDVGYGKTEIAIRAAFKCADNGKQTAVLAPTTILAAQHFETFKERFQDYPFRLEHISRFQTKSEQARIVRELEEGGIDIIIGTHRILGKDIAFKDLGLLAIDEEQRFGVMQKERLREKHSAVDTISFSATPIPRTLNMSFAGIYDYNLILRPPVDRLPVKTFAAELSKDALAYAIKTELAREGQVFCVVDKIELIETYVEAIKKLFPEAKIGVVHGRLPRDTAERTVMKFALRKINILIGTTILESGLDIGNANTMVILNADNFGLSTLYQLRGRVGRRSRQGYCYLFYEKADSLTEIQEERINAILHFTEFGAGFKIAMKDMEIRGSGNLLGKAQTGHIAEIGYNLYNKLVAEELAKLSAAPAEGEGRGETEDAAEEISAKVNLPVSAYISDDYIEDYEVKLDFYRRIAEIKSEEEKSEMLSELTDRFGAVLSETQNLLDIALIKFKATELKWENVSYNKTRKSVIFSARGRRTAIEASEDEAEILLEAKKFLAV